ncbi:hypothetical protein K5Y32_21980 [Pantoea sp. DY-15]|nr:hypothetical protein [Pantoea sp. DY-15]MBY4890612.1 hypothetical protein [Pantoea sp. DY-15]
MFFVSEIYEVFWMQKDFQGRRNYSVITCRISFYQGLGERKSHVIQGEVAIINLQMVQHMVCRQNFMLSVSFDKESATDCILFPCPVSLKDDNSVHTLLVVEEKQTTSGSLSSEQ